MKKINILLLILIAVVIIQSIVISQLNKENSNRANKGILETLDVLNKQYTTSLPIEYFDGINMGGNNEMIYLDKMGYWEEITPIEANSDEIEIINEPFEGFNNLSNKYEPSEPYWGDPVDVDGDGIKEQIFYYSTAMNHTPHIVTIVKDNKIIFRTEGPSVKLVSTESGNGFYIEEYNWNDVPSPNTKITRYVHTEGKFIPVWYRKAHVLEVRR